MRAPARRLSTTAPMLLCLLLGVPTLTTADPAMKPKAPAGKVVPYRAHELPDSARQIYAGQYGVDQLWVQLTESGNLVKFSYRVLDAAKAAPLNNGASAPALIDDRAHVSLQVPTMEKIGPLRQQLAPVAGKTYWMVFSNKGSLVKAGDRVSIAVGELRVDGLYVEK